MALIRKGQNSIKIWSECGWVVTNVLLLCLVISSDSFNIDTVNFIRHSGTPGSMFGFSVAEHRERGKNCWLIQSNFETGNRDGNQKGINKNFLLLNIEIPKLIALFKVLIGAPEAQTRQPGVTKGGAVYRCETSRDDACEEILFDSTDASLGKKTNQKFRVWEKER
ncbi:hypothetical protein RUM44_002793 [Polyplax serrata]|uniref:Uncharacterized protein n=1 Tax=Polyplax serrata TaxID=468196 RepID=A0ABR1AFQ7_POLSC